MKREIILTKDGSHSIAIPDLGETYHSHHGAIQESMHVYIEAGLVPALSTTVGKELRVLEIGFGSGLNALLTFMRAEKLEQPIHYIALEPFPLTIEESTALNYCEQLQRPDLQPFFNALHFPNWEQDQVLDSNFVLHKSAISLLNYSQAEPVHLIYFDAFSPSTQPELWSVEVFKNLYRMLAPGALLVTYCSKSIVRKAMKAAGFTVKKLNGPRGKREMVSAIKTMG